MKLIIAEKPELGRAIADALPGSGRTEQAVVYKGDYAVVWAYGHLLTLKDPEDYDRHINAGRWMLCRSIFLTGVKSQTNKAEVIPQRKNG